MPEAVSSASVFLSTYGPTAVAFCADFGPVVDELHPVGVGIYGNSDILPLAVLIAALRDIGQRMDLVPVRLIKVKHILAYQQFLRVAAVIRDFLRARLVYKALVVCPLASALVAAGRGEIEHNPTAGCPVEGAGR